MNTEREQRLKEYLWQNAPLDYNSAKAFTEGLGFTELQLLKTMKKEGFKTSSNGIRTTIMPGDWRMKEF